MNATVLRHFEPSSAARWSRRCRRSSRATSPPPFASRPCERFPKNSFKNMHFCRGVNANEDEFILNLRTDSSTKRRFNAWLRPRRCARRRPTGTRLLFSKIAIATNKSAFCVLISHASTVEERRHHSRASQRGSANASWKTGLWLNSAVGANAQFLQAAQGNKCILHLETSRRIQDSRVNFQPHSTHDGAGSARGSTSRRERTDGHDSIFVS